MKTVAIICLLFCGAAPMAAEPMDAPAPAQTAVIPAPRSETWMLIWRVDGRLVPTIYTGRVAVWQQDGQTHASLDSYDPYEIRPHYTVTDNWGTTSRKICWDAELLRLVRLYPR